MSKAKELIESINSLLAATEQDAGPLKKHLPGYYHLGNANRLVGGPFSSYHQAYAVMPLDGCRVVFGDGQKFSDTDSTGAVIPASSVVGDIDSITAQANGE